MCALVFDSSIICDGCVIRIMHMDAVDAQQTNYITTLQSFITNNGVLNLNLSK